MMNELCKKCIHKDVSANQFPCQQCTFDIIKQQGLMWEADIQVPTYTVAELTRLWAEYHDVVHPYKFTPCDACPGDPCSVEMFLTWLDATGVDRYEH